MTRKEVEDKFGKSNGNVEVQIIIMKHMATWQWLMKMMKLFKLV